MNFLLMEFHINFLECLILAKAEQIGTYANFFTRFCGISSQIAIRFNSVVSMRNRFNVLAVILSTYYCCQNGFKHTLCLFWIHIFMLNKITPSVDWNRRLYTVSLNQPIRVSKNFKPSVPSLPRRNYWN